MRYLVKSLNVGRDKKVLQTEMTHAAENMESSAREHPARGKTHVEGLNCGW
jgi:hypothetical protein